LDGLNEIPAHAASTEIKAFREKCKRCEIPLICSTREMGGGDLGIQRKLEIQPLDSGETDRFLQECLPEHQDQVRQLLQRDNRDLSRTPFVLWMLYHLLQETGTIAETLGEAFRQFFRFHCRSYKEDVPVPEERRKAWNSWMEHLAFTMLCSPDPLDPGLVITKEKAENILAERFGELQGNSSRILELEKYYLLAPVSDREISFKHQLIQEYYAAECLLEKLKEEPQLLQKCSGQEYAPFQIRYLNQLKWTEVINIMFGFPKEIRAYRSTLLSLAFEVDPIMSLRLTKNPESPDSLALKEILEREFSQGTISTLTKIYLLLKLSPESIILSYQKDINRVGPEIQKCILMASFKMGNLSILADSLEAMMSDKVNIEFLTLIMGFMKLLLLRKGKIADEIEAVKRLENLCEELRSRPVYVESITATGATSLTKRSDISGLLALLKHRIADIRICAANELASRASPKDLELLQSLYSSDINHFEYIKSISLVQERFGFYNYKIHQIAQEIRKRNLQMAGKPKNDFSGANFYAPVNFGDNPKGDFIRTQNNFHTDAEVQNVVSDLKILLTQLQDQHPSVNTESEALAIIDAEFTEIRTSRNHKLATLRKQLLNPERHLQACKAAAGEVAKHYLEDSVWAKTIITYIDKLSEEPGYGA